MASQEEWKPIRGYEGLYDISDQGQVRSYHNNKWGKANTPKIVAGRMGKHYKTAILCNEKGKRTFYIHRLVAEAFLPKPHGSDYVNHKNGNKLDNSVANLEWCTHTENMRHADATGLATFRRTPVECVETGERFSSISAAAKSCGLTRNAVGNCITGYAKTAGNKHWRCVE